mmetsp:Transcript_45023/g.119123  ORF Transcript_45023/g.119123 Transcript_45023/m.119123 type:complete len:228 (-) Transcript_45023:1544-2227(-)
MRQSSSSSERSSSSCLYASQTSRRRSRTASAAPAPLRMSRGPGRRSWRAAWAAWRSGWRAARPTTASSVWRGRGQTSRHGTKAPCQMSTTGWRRCTLASRAARPRLRVARIRSSETSPGRGVPSKRRLRSASSVSSGLGATPALGRRRASWRFDPGWMRCRVGSRRARPRAQSKRSFVNSSGRVVRSLPGPRPASTASRLCAASSSGSEPGWRRARLQIWTSPNFTT